MPSSPETFEARVNPAKEIAEIARDFVQPLEVLREALHNAYDAGATEVRIRAYAQTLAGGDRVLSLDIRDNGHGMNTEQLKGFFGLGFSLKDGQAGGRPPIGFKGHGTKIFYQARTVTVLTQRENEERLAARFDEARKAIHSHQLPEITLYRNGDASNLAAAHDLSLIADHGTTIRLVDYMANSADLIDRFSRRRMEDYLRWFTIFGSFRPVVDSEHVAPMTLTLQGTDETRAQPVSFGHPWPTEDATDPRALKAKDPRRPYSFFCKTFASRDLPIQGGYRIAIAVLFEGRRGRLERDRNIKRPRVSGLYHESERYGLWVCKDFIPIEPRFEWLAEEGCPLLEDSFDFGLNHPLVLVNCQDFSLTANRTSVGNSPDPLLSAVKAGVFEYLGRVLEDPDYKRFRIEHREDLFARLREKDRSALVRRIERFNGKKLLTARLPGGREYTFPEPQREITLFGLIAQLEVLAPELLELDVLDYDDHAGIDLLVRRGRDVNDLLSRDKVAYTEIKYLLESQINHPFVNLSAIICWDTDLKEKAPVTDPVNEQFTYGETVRQGVTYSHLLPEPTSEIKHTIRVIVLRRLLQERCALSEQENPRPIALEGARGVPRRRR